MSVETQLQLYEKSHDDFNSAGNDEFPPSLWGSVFKLLTDKGGKPHADPLVFEYANQAEIRELDDKYGPDEPVLPGQFIGGLYVPHGDPKGRIYIDERFREFLEDPNLDDPVLKEKYEKAISTVNHEKAHQIQKLFLELGITKELSDEESEDFADDYASRGPKALSRYGDVGYLSKVLLENRINPELESFETINTGSKLRKYNLKNYGGMSN